MCCLALNDLDQHLYSRILLLLSNDSPISDNLVQESALKATTVLVRRYFFFHLCMFSKIYIGSRFPEIAPNMVFHLRRFVTSPLPLFEYGFHSENRAPPPLSAAAKCLALCIKVSMLIQFFYSHPKTYFSWPLATTS